MKYIVKPGGLIRGEVKVPGDKSISHRALMLGGIAEGETDITRLPRQRGLPRDACSAAEARRDASSVRSRQRVIVHGVGMGGPEGAGRRRSTWATPARRCGSSWDCWPRSHSIRRWSAMPR